MAADQKTVGQLTPIAVFPHSHICSGPAKDSLKVLQSRLHDIEICLLKVLSTISDDELTTALEKSTMNLVVSEDLGSQYPLDTTAAVRSWQRVRTPETRDQGQNSSCPLESIDSARLSPNYDVDTVCATEHPESETTWQIASAPSERGHAAVHAATRLHESLSGESERGGLAKADELTLSRSSNPPSTHLPLAGYSPMKNHDVQRQQPVLSDIQQYLPGASGALGMASLPLQQQEFPGHLFW